MIFDESRRTSRERKQHNTLSSEMVLAFVSLIVFLVMLLTTDVRYLDFGDGNYLYISWRLLEGAKLYTDLLTPQPPVLFVIGSVLLGFYDSWKTARLFSIVLGIATGWLVFKVSLQLFRNRRIALLSALTYYLLPIHLLWGRGFQADPLATFLSLVSLSLFLHFDRGKMMLSSVFMVLAVFTKYTFIPIAVVNAVYLGRKRRELLSFFAVPLVILSVVIFGFLSSWTSGAFIKDTIIAQSEAPPYPLDFPLDVALRGFTSVLQGEGTFIFLSFVGILFLLLHDEEKATYCLGTLIASFIPLVLVLRQGTGTYIFYGAEPYIAMFSSYGIHRLIRIGMTGGRRAASLSGIHTRRSRLRLAVLCLSLSSLLAAPSLNLLLDQFMNFQRYDNWSNARNLEIIIGDIEEHTSPNDDILCPPYFAFLTKRRLVFDYSETWLWRVLYERNDQEARILVESIATRLEHRSLGIAILDWRMRSVGPIYRAITQNYVLIRRILVYDVLDVYIPKSTLDGGAEFKCAATLLK